ncbi:uncharacterized protein LOC143372182 [Andrena cerasifolii]|uniref:uncharacterized protein LOC143372182 n=1 Tax=Andrena cerasifolii TaxID=2819439 RepID=UPI004037DD05
MDFIERMLSMPRYTPRNMVRTETGRIKLEVEVMKRALRYWGKITQMKEKRFPRRCWEKLQTLDRKTPDIKRNWVTQIRNILQLYGYDTTNRTKAIEQEVIQQKILEEIAKVSIEEDRNRISRSTYRVSVLSCNPRSRELVKWQQRLTDAFHYNHAPAQRRAASARWTAVMPELRKFWMVSFKLTSQRAIGNFPAQVFYRVSIRRLRWCVQLFWRIIQKPFLNSLCGMLWIIILLKDKSPIQSQFSCTMVQIIL